MTDRTDQPGRSDASGDAEALAEAERGDALARLTAVRAEVAHLIAFDCVAQADLIPQHVDVPDDYESGINDAGHRLRAVLDAPSRDEEGQ